MISALSGSTSTQLLSLFARPQANSTAGTTQAVPRPPPPGPPPAAGNGVSPQSLFDALVSGGNSSQPTTDSSSSNPLDDLMSSLLNSLDTDGDGKLSADELKSAVATLQGDTSGSNTTDASPDATTSTTGTFTGGAKSLYESLFNAMASMTGSQNSSSQLNALSQKFLTALSV